MKRVYSNIRGTSDFDPEKTLAFNNVNEQAKKLFKLFGYEEVLLPILEERELFIKSVGQGTDIVERQMFKIETKDIVLRPEGTAQIIRYYLQNSLHKKSDFHKFFYAGAMFRGERPQKGRLRQFHHLGIEAIGSDSIYLDAEVMILALRILDKVGVKDKELKLNTLGCEGDKLKFSKYLKSSLSKNKSKLCDDCQKRLEKNPLRIIDCKNRDCKKIVQSLSLEGDHLCSECKVKFKDLLLLLDDLGLKYTNSPYLVRGLDYYTNTVFEITSKGLGSQDAIGAGGRYNDLIKSLGGPDIPAIGFALGLERVLLLLDNLNDQPKIDVSIALADKELVTQGFKLLNELRMQNISSGFDYCGKSLKAQLRIAQRRGSKFVVILGQEELKYKAVLLKDMQRSTQDKVNLETLVNLIKNKV